MQKGQTQVLILAGIVILLALAGGIFFLGRLTAPKTQTPVVTSSPQPSDLSTEASAKVENPTTNWKTYTNSTYGYSFKYPEDWSLDTSKVEPATYNNAIASPNTSSVILTKDGYEFSFSYYLEGVGGVCSIAAKVEEVDISGSKFLKKYVNTKSNPLCFPEGAGGEGYKPKQECYDHFNVIWINSFPDTYSCASSFVHINGKNSEISFSLPKLIKVGDKEFSLYEEAFNQILSTFRFTQ